MNHNIVHYENGNIGYETWRENSEWHRLDGPAYIAYFSNGHKSMEAWYRNGQEHRDGDEPSEIQYDEDGEILVRKWYKNGEYHRENGPARIDNTSYGQTDWYLYNICLFESEFNEHMKILKTITTREHAIMNIRHDSEIIRRRCQEIIDGL